jgi:hypothetical protein
LSGKISLKIKKVMKKVLLLLIVSMCLATALAAQGVNGRILSTHHNLTVVKVWGTHEERGYAAGYLLAEQFTDAYENYIAWAFGPYLPYAKQLIQHPYFFYIDPEYIAEAHAFIDGVHAAGYGEDLDFADVLVGNCFLDIQGVLAGLADMKNGCSSLMSWGEATKKTDLNGKSVITRHLDWDIIPILLRNQVMVIHIPAEENEQPWLLIGFAGQISVMSGVNESGVAIMHQSMNDLVTPGTPYCAYEPITFSMRRAIERIDLNGDGVNNVQDIVTALTANPMGFANNYIITGLAPSTSGGDEQIAIVAEVANTAPYYSIRHNTYADNIPGQNLYAANACISRNNALNYCDRYTSIVEQMGDGTKMSSKRAWEMMKTYSLLPDRNLQFLQFIPEKHSLKLGVHQMDGTIASQAHILRFNTIALFKMAPGLKDAEAIQPMEVEPVKLDDELLVFPNPARNMIRVFIPVNAPGTVSAAIYNVLGEQVYHRSFISAEGRMHLEVDIAGFLQGTYFLRVSSSNGTVTEKFIVVK